MVDVDSETLFNGFAAALTTAAVLVFVFNVDLGYSPVTSVAVVLAFLAGVLAVTQRTEDRQLTFFGYVVVVVSVVGLFFDLVNTFDLWDGVTVLGLLVLSALLFGLRAGLDDGNRLLSERRALSLFGALAALAVVVLVVDVATGGLAYELQPDATVEITQAPQEDLTVGSVAVTNPTPLPERVEIPSYGACAAGNWREFRPPSEPGVERPLVHTDLHVEHGYNDHVLGFSSRTYPVRLYLEAANTTGETFPIERTDSCPDDDTGSPYIAIYERSNRDRRVVAM